MGLGDVLFGRKKLAPAAPDRLFALTTAAVTLETSLSLRFAGAGAIVFKPLSAGEFDAAAGDMRDLLANVARDTGTTIERTTDSYGYDWIVARDPELEDAVGAVHVVASELVARGFGEQLLAAPFRFAGGPNPVFWIYGFKRGTWWPFVPIGMDERRDNATELELKAKLERELPVEQDLTRWLGLFGAPL